MASVIIESLMSFDSSLLEYGFYMERFRACGRDQVRSRTGGFPIALDLRQHPLLEAFGNSAQENPPPNPSLPREGWHRPAVRVYRQYPDFSRETNHDLLFNRKVSNSSWNRSSCPCAFSPPSVGRGRGRVLTPKCQNSPKECIPEESRGDRKASGRARRRGTSLSPQLAGEMSRSDRGAVSNSEL